MTTVDDTVILDFPAGAFTDDAEVTIEPIPCGAAPKGFRMGNTCFGVVATVDGEVVTELGTDMTICVEYTPDDLTAADGNPAHLTLAYYDETAGEWQILPKIVGTTDGTVCATTSHLSDWAVLAQIAGGLLLWHYLLIGLGALVVLVFIVMLLTRRTIL